MTTFKSTPRKINIEDYQLLGTLGSGGFAKVLMAKDKKSEELVAVKVMEKQFLIQNQHTEHIINEVSIMSTISHPFIVSFRGMTQDNRCLYLMLELVKGGELYTHLRNVRRYPPEHARFVLSQIVCAFDYLHQNDIVYRDLKPENVMIGEDGYMKLTDFGFAKHCRDKTYTFCGTPEYLAPEIILNKGHGKAVDWWTLGILLYELLIGIDPFHDPDPMMIYEKILKRKLKFRKDTSQDAKSLIKHLLQEDLSKRYGNLKNGVNDIKRHLFFQDFDWGRLSRKEIAPFYVPPPKAPENNSNDILPDGAYNCNAPAVKPEEDPFLKW